MEQKNKGWKKREIKTRVRREAWLGAVIGHVPVPLPAFFSLSSPPPPPLSLHPQVTELSSREEGMKRLRENYTESFSLTRRGKWRVGETSNNFWKDGVGSGRRAGQEKDRQIQGEKRQKKPSGIWGHSRWREGDSDRSELEKKQNPYVDPRQKWGYCGGRKVLSLR